MKSATTITTSLILLLNAALVHAHWVTSNFILNHTITREFEFVRRISPHVSSTTIDPETLLAYPVTDPTSSDLRCGRNASVVDGGTKVARVGTGSEIGFFVGRGITKPPAMYHPGYGSAWLSRVEDGDLDGYEGEGDWYKIHQTAGRTEQSVDFEDPANKPYYDQLKALWGTFQAKSWSFTIPATTPPGKYLVRWEQVFPNVQDTQFYVNCAHLEVSNDGHTIEPEQEYMVKIPGLYVRGQKDVYFSTYDYGLKGSLEGFIPPKPDVWVG